MNKNIYLSYKCDDTDKACMIKNQLISQGFGVQGFDDTIDFYAIKHQGEAAVVAWIESQLFDSDITIVVLGQNTLESGWVELEIKQSLARGNQVIFVNMRNETEHSSLVKDYCATLASEAPLYHWQQDQGATDLHEWVDQLELTDAIFLNRPDLYNNQNKFSLTAF
jgi:hypothetical protein